MTGMQKDDNKMQMNNRHKTLHTPESTISLCVKQKWEQ